MKNIDFPIFKTRSPDGSDHSGSEEPSGSVRLSAKKFDLTDAKQRQEYFDYKAGDEIKKLREYLKNNTFIVYLLGKKNTGKGTYSKMFKEIVDSDLPAPVGLSERSSQSGANAGLPVPSTQTGRQAGRIEHVSVGDLIRSFDDILKDESKKEELVEFLKKRYRGPMPLEDLIKAMEERSTKVLLPSELILALVEKEITKLGKKAIFIDGFPRDVDQVSYSLFFKNLIDYRNDPDIFVLIDVPTNVIDERIKYRLICPLCQTSRNLKLLATKNVEYEKQSGKFYLLCDNPECTSPRMVTKEGDELGIEPIRERLERDGMLMEQIHKMHGISKIFLRNSIPIDKVKDFADDYEITPEYVYSFDENSQKAQVKEKPWEFKDDQGVISNSLMPPPVVVSLIKQLVKILGL